MVIDNIDAVPNASGCNHVTLECDVNGVTRTRTFTRAELTAPLTSEEIEQAVLSCIRIHVRDIPGNPTFAQIRANLQAWSLTL